MKVLVPDYYEAFSCLAGECRHSCCIGWEIDIDECTAEYYRTIGGEFGKKLKNSILEDDSGAGFILSEGEERCPFLNSRGLCDIILTLGEDSLCQICSDHPRFRNYFSGRTEIGLGLCCEAAAKLILTDPAPVKLHILCEDKETEDTEQLSEEESALLRQREKLIRTAQDRSRPFRKRLEALSSFAGLPFSDLVLPPEFMLSLEQLSPVWTEKLVCLQNFRRKPGSPKNSSELLSQDDFDRIFDRHPFVFEQFLVYLIFRHFPDAARNGETAEILSFLLSSVRLIAELSAALSDASAEDVFPEEINEDKLIELIREWSSEIEYSDENVEKIKEYLI